MRLFTIYRDYTQSIIDWKTKTDVMCPGTNFHNVRMFICVFVFFRFCIFGYPIKLIKLFY